MTNESSDLFSQFCCWFIAIAWIWNFGIFFKSLNLFLQFNNIFSAFSVFIFQLLLSLNPKTIVLVTFYEFNLFNQLVSICQDQAVFFFETFKSFDQFFYFYFSQIIFLHNVIYLILILRNLILFFKYIILKTL